MDPIFVDVFPFKRADLTGAKAHECREAKHELLGWIIDESVADGLGFFEGIGMSCFGLLSPRLSASHHWRWIRFSWPSTIPVV